MSVAWYWPDWDPDSPVYDCCEHCQHDINDPPHDRPCLKGCNDDDA